ncbi:MAG: transposase [Sphaerochaetaceae bacterium]|nr:transposase [Sphaerochaetaceae bacterium]
MKEHGEDYHRRFGYYPQSILTDKIYRTGENLRYCKESGIRLAGPPLGRPPKDQGVYRAMLKEFRRDEMGRIPIEGRLGVAKRTYTLTE